MVSKLFGKKINELRVLRKLTLNEAAKIYGTSKDYVWQLENKTSGRPSAKLVLDIADFYRVEPAYLIDDDKLHFWAYSAND